MGTKQIALKIYLAQLVFDARLCLDSTKLRAKYCCLDTSVSRENWKRAIVTAERLYKFAVTAHRLAQRFGLACSVGYFLSILDREHELLVWELKMARSEDCLQYTSYASRREIAADSTKLVWTQLSAHLMRDLGTSTNLNEAISLLDTLIASGKAITLAAHTGHSGTRLIPAIPSELLCATSQSAGDHFRLHTLRHRSYLAVAKVHKRNIVANPDAANDGAHAMVLANVAADVALACCECITATLRAKESSPDWAEAWSRVAAELFTLIQAADALHDAGQPVNGSRVQQNLATVRDLQDKCAGLYEMWNSIAAQGRAGDNSGAVHEQQARVLKAIHQEICDLERSLIDSELVSSPAHAVPAVSGRFASAFAALEKRLQRCEAAISVDLAPQMAFYTQQAAAVDASLSPAHERVILLWNQAADRVLGAQAAVVAEWQLLESESDRSEGSKSSLWVKMATTAASYAHLAESLGSVAVSHYQQAQRCAKADRTLAARAWTLAGEFTLGAVETRDRVLTDGAWEGRLRSQEAVGAQLRGAVALETMATQLMTASAEAGLSPLMASAADTVLQLRAQEKMHRDAVLTWVITHFPVSLLESNPHFVCSTLDHYASAIVRHFFSADQDEPVDDASGLEARFAVVKAGAMLAVRCSEVALTALGQPLESQDRRRQVETLLRTVDSHLRGIPSLAIAAAAVDDAVFASARRTVRIVGLELKLAYTIYANARWQSYLLQWVVKLEEPALNATHSGAFSPMQEFHSQLARRLEQLAGLVDGVEMEVACATASVKELPVSERLECIVKGCEEASRLLRLALAEPTDSRLQEGYARAAKQTDLYALYVRFRVDLTHDPEHKQKVPDKALQCAAAGAKRAAELLQMVCEAQQAGRPESVALLLKAADCYERKEEPVYAVPKRQSHMTDANTFVDEQVAARSGRFYANAARALEEGRARDSSAWADLGKATLSMVVISGYSFGPTGFVRRLSTFSDTQLKHIDKVAKDLEARERGTSAVASAEPSPSPLSASSANRRVLPPVRRVSRTPPIPIPAPTAATPRGQPLSARGGAPSIPKKGAPGVGGKR